MSEQAVVFDKAAWHLDAVRERGLPDDQAFVHGGLFFGWATRRGLIQDWVRERTAAAFDAFALGEITGPVLFTKWDGAILDDLFTDVGLAFVAEYFDPKTGAYFSDYLTRVAGPAGGDYEVVDDAASADAVAAFLDERFDAWRREWDPSAGRPDLRVGLSTLDEVVPDVLRAPVLVTGSGVALPGGPLSLRATRPDTVVAVDAAMSGARLLVLAAPHAAGRATEYAGEDLVDVGVLARVEQAMPSPDRPTSRDVVLQCLHRVALSGWGTKGGLTVDAARIPAPTLSPDDEELLDVVRKLASAAVKARAIRGMAPGTLPLASVMRGDAVIDVVARELTLSREERLIVLLSPDLQDRGQTVVDALQRELE